MDLNNAMELEFKSISVWLVAKDKTPTDAKLGVRSRDAWMWSIWFDSRSLASAELTHIQYWEDVVE